MADPTASIPMPLSFYVVFHESCEESQKLAHQLFRWLRMEHDDGDAVEAGLPVWYRCRVRADTAGQQRLHPSIRVADADLNVVVVLVSDKMVNDPGWRQALEVDLADEVAAHQDALAARKEAIDAQEQVGDPPGSPLLVLPVAVDDSFYRLAFLYQHTQPIRIGAPKPVVEPTAVPADLPRPDEPTWRTWTAAQQARKKADKKAEEDRLANRSGLLRRAVMEVVARTLRDDDWTVHPAKLQVFISHAKRDGKQIAEQLRDRLAGQSQLQAWYDANELPPGFAWDHPMEDAARKNTAALVSVVSDAYATRFWCRREVELARTPRPLLPEDGRAWTVQPAVAMHSEGGTFRRPMPALSQVVHIGWRSAEAQGDAVQEVVDRLLLEVLLAEFYRRLCRKLMAEDQTSTSDQTLYLSFVPDPWTLVRLTGEWRARAENRDKDLPTRIAYPGFGLRSGELLELRRVAQDLGYEQSDHLFMTLEEVQQKSPPTPAHGGDKALRKPIAVLSAGGQLRDMADRGASVEHADDLLVRLSLRLLRSGWRLAYGGTLGDLTSNVTRSLMEVARAYGEEAALADALTDSADGRKATSADLLEPPLINYAAWPNQRFLDEREKAAHVGICHFNEVIPSDRPKSIWKEQLGRLDTPLSAYLGAVALSEMRSTSAAAADFRVVVGGRTRNWAGWLPGIAEEVVASLGIAARTPSRTTSRTTSSSPYGQPLVILGGLGGCAGQLANYLLDEAADPAWPKGLSFEAAMAGDDKFKLLLQHSGARQEAHSRFESMKSAVGDFRTHLWSGDGDLFALAGAPTRDEFRTLLALESPTTAINMVMAIAQRMRTHLT